MELFFALAQAPTGLPAVLFDAMPFVGPEVLLIALAAVLLVIDSSCAVAPRVIGLAALAGVGLIALVTFLIPTVSEYSIVRHPFWAGLYGWEDTAKFFKLFFLAAAGLVIWMSMEAEPQIEANRAEFFILPLIVASGLCLLASVNDFTLLFVALELVTISFYILVAYQRTSNASLEAGVKYLIMGGVASAFLVMGIAYIFGSTGATQFSAIQIYLMKSGVRVDYALVFGLLLVLVGIGFKVSAVPFHFWAPDVYQGAPTPITAFLAVGSKAAGFVVLLRMLLDGFGGALAMLRPLAAHWAMFIEVAAVLSLLVGNLAAIPQRNLKRMLAYSSIGHSGFMLIAVFGLCVIPSASVMALCVYLITYFLATFLAFTAVVVLSRKIPGEQIHTYAGLWQRSPLLAGSIAVALVSMAGVPPLVGFIGKLSVLTVAWEIGLKTGSFDLFWAGVFASVAGLYYYLGVVKVMFWSEPLDRTDIPVSLGTRWVLWALIILTVLLGFWVGGLQWLTPAGLVSPV